MDFGEIAGACVLQSDVAKCVCGALAILVERNIFIPQLRIFEQRGDGVEAETGYAFFEPEGENVFEGLVDLGVVPVKVRLLDIELMIVVLARFLVPLPG